MCAIYFRSSPFTSKVPKNDVKLESFESEENCVCMRGKLFYLPYHPGHAGLGDVGGDDDLGLSIGTLVKYGLLGVEGDDSVSVVADNAGGS